MTVSDPFSALFSPSEGFQLPSLVLRHHFSQDFFSTVFFSCHHLDPVHVETTRKSRSSVPSQLKVCSANEAWLPSEKFSTSYRALARFLGAELNISTIQTRTIAQPSQRKNQLITRSPDWLPVVCVRFLEYVCKALVALTKKTIECFSENSGKKAEISGEENFYYSTG